MQYPEATPSQQPIMATRRQLETLFPGLCSRTLSNWAYEGKGPRYWRKGKNAWYDVQEVREFLTENPVNDHGKAVGV